MGIGAVLQKLLIDRGTNVNEVAVTTGVNPQTLYSMIKRDSMKANIEDLYKVAHHLGVDLNFFYNAITSDEPVFETNDFFSVRKGTVSEPTEFIYPARDTEKSITKKLPKLTDSQLESIERRVDVYIDDNEMEDREVISHRAKKAT